MGTDTFSLCVTFLLFAFLLHSSFSEEANASKRQASEIITGGGGENSSAPSYSPEGGCTSPSPPPPPPKPSCPPPPPPLSRIQKAKKVLLKFKQNIYDPNGYTNNWKGENPCKYNGIRCAQFPKTTEKAVAGIDLNGAGISGKNRNLTLLGFLDNIPELVFLHSNSNNFTGNIPRDISMYENFYELDLSNNKLVGEFPKEVLEATRLVFVDLRFNKFYGSIPPKLFQMDLDVIFINNNEFTGNLPDNFGSTPARFLTFANNKFSGPIPSSIGKASKSLTEVLFLGNQFSGCLPYEIGFLKNATVLDVSNNSLTGPIPHSFACLDSIQYLNFSENMFYGAVPEPLCELPGLRNKGKLTLSDNYFTQVGPECRKLIDAKVLDVKGNCILGLPDQKPECECSKFFSTVKPCPNAKSLNIVPCNKYYSGSKNVAPAPETTASPPSPVTYKALKP